MKPRFYLAITVIVTLLLTVMLAAPAASSPFSSPFKSPPISPPQKPVVTNEQQPLDMWVYVWCANGGSGELVELTGELHYLSTVSFNPAGNFSVQYHFQPMGVSGIGWPTGTKYQATGITRTDYRYGADYTPYVYTYVNNFRIIGAGPGNNYLIHVTYHTTVNADGTTTTVVYNATAECK